jgi:hypothetical protein
MPDRATSYLNPAVAVDLGDGSDETGIHTQIVIEYRPRAAAPARGRHFAGSGPKTAGVRHASYRCLKGHSEFNVNGTKACADNAKAAAGMDAATSLLHNRKRHCGALKQDRYVRVAPPSGRFKS